MIRVRARRTVEWLVQAVRRQRHHVRDPSVWLGANLELSGPSEVTLGPGVRVGHGTRIAGRVSIGDSTNIHRYVLLNALGGHIAIGQRCSANDFCVLYGAGGLTIGNDVRLATHTVIVTMNHNFADTDRPIREQGVTTAPVTIGDDVWIAANVTILAGVIIGGGSVIGAGAVVTDSIPPMSIAVGVPARVVRTRR